jgi:hypothetical protein
LIDSARLVIVRERANCAGVLTDRSAFRLSAARCNGMDRVAASGAEGLVQPVMWSEAFASTSQA